MNEIIDLIFFKRRQVDGVGICYLEAGILGDRGYYRIIKSGLVGQVRLFFKIWTANRDGIRWCQPGN